MKYKPNDGIGSSGLGGGGGDVGEMLVTSLSSIDQELVRLPPRLLLPEAELVPDASDDAGVTGDSRCLILSILQGASHL